MSKALEIASERYAKGEIGKDEFEEIKAGLSTGSQEDKRFTKTDTTSFEKKNDISQQDTGRVLKQNIAKTASEAPSSLPKKSAKWTSLDKFRMFSGLYVACVIVAMIAMHGESPITVQAIGAGFARFLGMWFILFIISIFVQKLIPIVVPLAFILGFTNAGANYVLVPFLKSNGQLADSAYLSINEVKELFSAFPISCSIETITANSGCDAITEIIEMSDDTASQKVHFYDAETSVKLVLSDEIIFSPDGVCSDMFVKENMNIAAVRTKNPFTPSLEDKELEVPDSVHQAIREQYAKSVGKDADPTATFCMKYQRVKLPNSEKIVFRTVDFVDGKKVEKSESLESFHRTLIGLTYSN